MTDKCKSCGAEIIWKLTGGGKRIPLDAKSEKRFVIWFNGIATLYDTYQTHFVTCPDAKEHRKK